jgi:hypothetical protein
VIRVPDAGNRLPRRQKHEAPAAHATGAFDITANLNVTFAFPSKDEPCGMDLGYGDKSS